MSIHEYKCPNCGGGIQFDSSEQKLVCPYCGTVMDVEALQALDESLARAQESEATDWGYQGEEWANEEQQGMAVYTCKSCGGEIIGDETMGATSCPFCGNPVLMPSKFSGTLKPDLVLPFKTSKEQALTALQNHYLNKKFLPAVFKDKNRLEEVKGVYVPFWLFDAEADVSIEFDGRQNKSWSDQNYDHEETSHYRIIREGSLVFDKVPIDGSEDVDDTLMESIEPFDFSEAVDFKTAYLAGFFANKYDVEVEECQARADERMRNSASSEFERTVSGYDELDVTISRIDVKKGEVAYALLPVWLLSTKWNGETYTFAMNGQTGKFVGDLPLDKSVSRKYFWGIFGGMAVVLTVLAQIIASR